MGNEKVQVVEAVDIFNTDAEMTQLMGTKIETDEKKVDPVVDETKKVEDEKEVAKTQEKKEEKGEEKPTKTSKDILLEALGKKVEVTVQDDEKEVLKKRLEDSERKIKVNDESNAIINLLAQMPKDELEILGPAVEEMVGSKDYKLLEGLSPEEKAANLILKARGLNFDKLMEIKSNGSGKKEVDGKVRETYEKIASGGPTRTAIDDPNKKLDELRQAAALGDGRAQDMLIELSMENGPEGEFLKQYGIK
jgi:hypothetical protein